MRGLFRHMGPACVVLVAILGLSPPYAHAHLVQTGFGAFYDGISHLFITPPDILVVIGLGLLAGLAGLSQSRMMMLTFPPAWLIGGWAGPLLLPAIGTLPWLTTLTFASVGILVAMAPSVPPLIIAVLGLIAGIVHGIVNGASMTAGGPDLLGLFGVALAVFTIVTLLAAGVTSLRAAWARIAVRVAGSWIAAIGFLMLGWLVRRGGS